MRASGVRGLLFYYSDTLEIFVVSTDHFRYELLAQLRRAASEGATMSVVTSAELCKSLPNGSRWSQACCDAMQAEINPGDEVLDKTSGMTVRYLLPRP
jgi:hypothetical protein